jgi:hypothetical protein
MIFEMMQVGNDVDKGSLVGAVFIDRSKAFDTIIVTTYY